MYDIIIDNPYEFRKDIIETLNLVLEIQKPFRLQLFSLVFFPGTRLYQKAQNDGIIDANDKKNYRKIYNFFEHRFHNFLFLLFNYPVPKAIMRILISEWALRIFDRKFFNRLGGRILTLRKELKTRRFNENS